MEKIMYFIDEIMQRDISVQFRHHSCDGTLCPSPDRDIYYDGDDYAVPLRLPPVRNLAQTMLNPIYLVEVIHVLCES